MSKVVYKPGLGAFIMSGFIALIGLRLGCCLAPLFIENCKDAIHICNECGTIKGKKKYLLE